MKKKLELIMAVIVIIAAIFLSAKNSYPTRSNEKDKKTKTVVIDPGHGGFDPGKIGVNKALEKDINLAIAKETKKLLEKEGIQVIMTRTSDDGLYQENSHNKKVEDMKNRCKLIENTNPVCTVSIHQNSYHEEGVSGAQVFYFEHSKEGKTLAEIIQKSLIEHLDKNNRRTEKANDTYYLLKKTVSPTVIVECGFLSNWGEAKKLVSKEYQKKVAEAICEGILEYIKIVK